jgi:hypothetical protein
MSFFDDENFYNKSLVSLLIEAPGDEEEEAEEAEGEEEGEEAAEDTEGEEEAEGEDAEGEDTEGEEGEGVGEEDSAEKKGSFEKSLDADLDAVFIDFESQARNAVVQESKLVRMLYEESDIDEINVQDFASNVARLVKNYENLLDMEEILVSRASEFLEDRYGEEAKDKLEDELVTTHGIEVNKSTALSDNSNVPLAIGATKSE